MGRRKNFLLVEDEALIRDGIRSLLEREDFVNEIYEASNKKEFTDCIESKVVHIVLLDFRLSGTTGLDLLKLLRKRNREVKVIAVTGLEGTELILNLLKAGVDGIVYKLDGYQEIRKAILHVLKGEPSFSEKVKVIIQQNTHRWDMLAPVTLSYGEKELLGAIAKGFTTKEISKNLKMPESTTETYRQRLMRKVNVSNTAALLAFAYRNGLL